MRTTSPAVWCVILGAAMGLAAEPLVVSEVAAVVVAPAPPEGCLAELTVFVQGTPVGQPPVVVPGP